MKPEELLFAKTHEWVHVADEGGKKIATVGISAFAIEQLTDIVFLELPEVGREVQANQPEVCEVESVKSVNDIYPPCGGKIVEVNSALADDNLQWLNEDPYGKAWLFKFEISDEAGLADLMNYQAYQKQCAEEA